MHQGTIEVKGKRYIIESNPVDVGNLSAQRARFSRFIERNGGCQRKSFAHEYKDHKMVGGYYRRLSFRDEFFIDGVIVDLSGETDRSDVYLVDPCRRSLEGDLRSGAGVRLSDYDGYKDYERKVASGFAERTPELTDNGTVTVVLEGVVKRLSKNAPKFYDVTGLPQRWPIPLQLRFKDESDEEDDDD